jgi:hypothetical protein
MPQEKVFKDAITKLSKKYTDIISDFTCRDFLKSGMDPFRFSFNTEIWGLETAVRKEIEHKIEMKLEGLFGVFHEDYLGNCIHEPSESVWKIIPPGQMPGIDIANDDLGYYLQVKGKHNSMNSSSSKRLAQELSERKKEDPSRTVGCGWVIAGPSKTAIGEKDIRKVAKTLKGRELFAFVTGNTDEMNELIDNFPSLLAEIKDAHDFNALIIRATKNVIKELESRAKLSNTDIRGYLYRHAVR